MRKIILVIFLLTGVAFGLILYKSWISLVHIQSAVPGIMPLRVQEDLAYVLSYGDGGDDLPQLTLSFSHESHFYSETIDVTITAGSPDAAIYYTLDRSAPSASVGSQYTQPLIFEAGDDTQCYLLKAVAIDERESTVLTHSYFVGQNVEERFSTQYIFSLSSDPDGLYGYENGILVAGKLYDDFMLANPDTDIREMHKPANYNSRGRDWEREVYVEIFTQKGQRILTQDAGIRVHGTSSRTLPQKSLRLIARNEYEHGEGRFNYALFNRYAASNNIVKPVLSYDTIILRYGDFRFNDYISSQLSYAAGFHTVSPQDMAIVFINGEYYGFTTLVARINEQFLQDLYSAPDKSFDILDGGIQSISGDEAADDEYRQLVEYAQQGFTDDVLGKFNRFFDIDDFLAYYAIQTYTANSDWLHPFGNVKIWRYTGTDASDGDDSAKELDGRWRFVLLDMDGTINNDELSSPDINSLDDLYYLHICFAHTNLFQLVVLQGLRAYKNEF